MAEKILVSKNLHEKIFNKHVRNNKKKNAYDFRAVRKSSDHERYIYKLLQKISVSGLLIKPGRFSFLCLFWYIKKYA